MTPETPVIHADIGDGKRRRFYLGADELRQIKRECGRGFYTLYVNFERDAEPDEVQAVLRLALIGGGEAPKDALELVEYYAAPPRPMKDAYLLAFRALNAAWAGADQSGKGGEKVSASDIDDFFNIVEAALVKAGSDASVLRGKSFAEIQELFAQMRGDKDAPPAPDADTFNAIKKASKKGRKP